MAYSKAKLEKQAIDAITKHRLVFDDEVISFLPCGKTTYYAHKLNESNAIKAELERNRVELKSGLRQKMYKSDNATAWIAFYKLLGTDEEAERLNGTKQRIEHSGSVDVTTRTIEPGD